MIQKISLLFSLLVMAAILPAHSQYTETINSNRPGESQGAFAVGPGVYQLEAGAYMGKDEHRLFESETDIMGTQYGLRVGFLTEILELNFFGSFQDQTTRYLVGNTDTEYNTRNFPQSTFGAKFLLFDPAKSLPEDEVNLYSWKANQKFKWKKLIPAVAVYGGANLNFWENPLVPESESVISPKAAIITQNNWGRWVLITNFIADKFTEEYDTYAAIVTLTHAFNPKFAIFGEYQGIISDFYADDILRGGAAYLFRKNFQVDVSGLVNFKDTPSRWQVAAGVSYRLDFHKDDDISGESLDGIERQERSNRQRNYQNDF